MIVGVDIPNEQPLMKIQKSDFCMYPAAILPLNKLGYYSNIISKYMFTQINSAFVVMKYMYIKKEKKFIINVYCLKYYYI